MSDPTATFARLAKGPRFNSLWLAHDHLLWVTGEGFLTSWSETYARFYLRDVEGLFTAPSGEWTAVTVILGLLGLAALPMAPLFWRDPPAGMVWLAVAAALLLWVVARLLRGRGVVLHVQTAAGTVPTAHLPRPHAQRLLAQLAPLIQASQPDLPPLKQKGPGEHS